MPAFEFDLKTPVQVGQVTVGRCEHRPHGTRSVQLMAIVPSHPSRQGVTASGSLAAPLAVCCAPRPSAFCRQGLAARGSGTAPR